MKFKDNRGFTLVETTVTLLILIVVIALTGSILVTSFGLYGRNTTLNEAKVLGDNVYRYLSGQLTYATHIITTDDVLVDKYDTCMQVGQNGRLMVWNTETKATDSLFGDDYYNGMSVKTTSSVKNGRWLNLKVTVFDPNNKEVYSTASTFEVINMRLAVEQASEGGSGIGGSEIPPSDPLDISQSVTGKTGELSNAVFCYNTEITVLHKNFSMAALTMYQNALDSISFVIDNKGKLTDAQWKDLYGCLYHRITNDSYRLNVRTHKYSDKRWPILSSELLRRNSIDGYGDMRKIGTQEIQFHYDTSSASIMLYSVTRKEDNPQNDYYAMPRIVFVPDDEKGTTGTWYTNYPTVKNPTKPKYSFSLTQTGRDVWAIYEDLKKNWNPLY